MFKFCLRRLQGALRRSYTDVMNEPVHTGAPARRGRPPNKSAPGETGRTNDPARTMAEILDVATQEFASKGLSGARIDEIAAATRTSKRMIYYYFGSKEALFIAVLEDTYRRFNDAESALALDTSRPDEAMRTVIRFIWGYYQKNPDFITLLNTENLHRGKHIGKSLRAREYSSPAISITERVLQSGAEQGLFRADVAARDIYLMIAALGYFYLSNRFTLSAFLGEALEAPEAMAHWEAFLIDAVLRTVAAR